MAQLIEAKGNAFLAKCKGAAVIITAATGLILGILNMIKEVKDPLVKTSYQEISKQVESLSGDVRRLVTITRQQAEEISTLQNWVIDRQGRDPTVLKIAKQTKERMKIVQPPMRKPEQWDALRMSKK